MTIDRLALGIVVLMEHLAKAEGDMHLFGVPREQRVTAVKEGLKARVEDLEKIAECVQEVVQACTGDTMEQLARELINNVAATNKAKRFQMFVVEGDGLGAWEAVVRRDRDPTDPPFKPVDSKSRIILPKGFKLQ